MRIAVRMMLIFIVIVGMFCTVTLQTAAHAASKKVKKSISTETNDRGIEVVGKRQDTRKRFALVIGNSSYQSSPLKNPVNDARAIATTLRKLGFTVDERVNLGYMSFNEALESFGDKLRAGGVGLFYYAGHGMQVNGSNYLIPVDAKINSENEVRYKTIDVGLVLAKMEQAKSDVNIAILDACRDNPFSRSFRSSNKGLAQVDAPTGTIIAYATAPGKTANDGSLRNSVYTEALLNALQAPSLKVEEVFKRVRKIVIEKTSNAQIPWESSSLTGEFYFKYPPARQTVSIDSQQVTSEEGKSPSTAATQNALDSPAFNNELDSYIAQSNEPLMDLKRLASSGDLLGQARLCAVATIERYNLGISPEEGIATCRALAEKSIPIGQYLYGMAFCNGRGVTKNEAEGVKWYRLAAERGNSFGINALGLAYMNGKGVAKDEYEAVKWYRKAVEKGNPLAMTNLGSAYMNGKGVAKDEYEAVEWYRKAVEKGNPLGMFLLGVAYERGDGVQKDKTEAISWYRKSAEKGDVNARNRLKQIDK